MNIRKTVVASLIERLNTIDKLSRRKNLTAEELQMVAIESVKAIRSTLTTLRKLK